MDAEATFFKTLADATRLRLAVLLALNGETCVCELAAALAAPEFRVSRHLGIMKDRGLVEARRAGTWMHYRLAHPRAKLEECLQECFRDCLAGHATVRADLRRLRRFRDHVRACSMAENGVPKTKEHNHGCHSEEPSIARAHSGTRDPGHARRV